MTDNSQYLKDLEAVKQDGYALRYVKEQTPEICLAAIQNEPRARLLVNCQEFEALELFL
jgi:hypothetical protein